MKNLKKTDPAKIAYATNVVNGQYFLATENDRLYVSVPFTRDANIASDVLLTAEVNEQIVLKGMVLSGQSNQGEIHLTGTIGGVEKTLLPVFLSNFSRASTTGNLNLILDAGTDVKVTIDGIGSGDEIFIGLTYYKLVGDE